MCVYSSVWVCHRQVWISPRPAAAAAATAAHRDTTELQGSESDSLPNNRSLYNIQLTNNKNWSLLTFSHNYVPPCSNADLAYLLRYEESWVHSRATLCIWECWWLTSVDRQIDQWRPTPREGCRKEDMWVTGEAKGSVRRRRNHCERFGRKISRVYPC